MTILIYVVIFLAFQGACVPFRMHPNLGNAGLYRKLTYKSVKLDFNEDLYDVLEVSPAASPLDLKKAYYKIVFKV
jgi:hypothetical protein